jgi:dUTP pyrophosphatase
MIQFKKTNLAKDLEHRINYTDSSQELGTQIDFTPRRANPHDAGLDLFAAEEVVIPPRGSALIATGVHIAIPAGHAGLLWSRSGLSVNHKLERGAGCIDSGYQGEVKAHIYNNSDSFYYVKLGDKIVQMLVVPVNTAMCIEVDEFEEVTNRNEGGFGSSGK